MSTKRTSKFQFLPIICKTKSVTYPFYCIFRKLPKFLNFSGGKAKSCSVELKLYRKSRFFELQNIALDNFHLNVSIRIVTLNITSMQKIRMGHRAKFHARFISGSRDFTPHFYFRYFACATFKLEISVHLG